MPSGWWLHSSWMLSLASRDQCSQRLHSESPLNSQGGKQLIGIIRLRYSPLCLKSTGGRAEVRSLPQAQSGLGLCSSPGRSPCSFCGTVTFPCSGLLRLLCPHAALSCSHLHRQTQLQSAKSKLQMSVRRRCLSQTETSAKCATEQPDEPGVR